MAAKKTTTKKAPVKKGSEPAVKKAGVLTAATIAFLMGLPESYAARPDQPVRDGEQESKALSLTLTKLGQKLVTHGGLSKGAEKDLIKRRAWLEESERAWISERDFAVKKDIVALRKEGAALKQLTIPALRHFLRADREIQVRLDRIAEGSGDLDLADDLIKAADLTEANLKALKTPDITKATPARMRKVSALISESISERNTDIAATRTMQVRNRAYWHLYDLVTEIQSAGRFVYRGDPAALKLFRVLRRQK